MKIWKLTIWNTSTRTTAAIFSIAAVLAVTAGAAAAGEYQGTVEQQLACTPDVFKFCGSDIPDVDRIVACLRQNTAQLSGSCRSVFEANASMPPNAAAPPATPPNRAQPRTLPQYQR